MIDPKIGSQLLGQQEKPMTEFSAPLQDMNFIIREVAGLDSINTLPGLEEATPDLVEAVLEEANKFCSQILAPLNQSGDREKVQWKAGVVKTASGWKDAYNTFVKGGWNGLAFDAEFGGQGLPWLVGAAFNEMMQAANMSFGLCPLLNQGAIEALIQHGSDELKTTYLKKLVSGEWCGTMNLTEPQAGSDLAAVRTKAVPEGDHYRISGQKIFITYGDHNLSDNIIHLVLARLPDAPEGVKGISLFLVPKILVNDEGTLGEANDVQCISLEEKLGIHASPTAVMAFGDQDGAIGYLIGEPHRGLEYMFTMMNLARLSVGIQGLAIGERAYQQALSYAKDRVQGRTLGAPDNKNATIIQHPDVRRMLMSIKCRVEAMRALAYTAMGAMDNANHQPDDKEKKRHQARVDFLTPIVKGWCTETGIDVASLGIQVHGGTGYIEETGAAQHLRDARITSIYEGTTAIQANDLINRKFLRDDGKGLNLLLEEIRKLGQETATAPGKAFRSMARELLKAVDQAQIASNWILKHKDEDPRLPAAASVPFLMLMGTLTGGWLMAKASLKADAYINAKLGNRSFMKAKIITAAFYAEHHLPEVRKYASIIRNGSETVFGLTDDQF